MLSDRLAAWVNARGESVDHVAETHLSVLVFGATRTYKAKKAVTYGFVDLSTVERRTAVLDAELSLNRRFSPDVYIERVEMPAAASEPGEPVLVMRRLPDDRRLATVVQHGGGADCVESVAAQLARVHAASPHTTEIDACATSTAMTALWSQELAEVQRFVGSVLDPAHAQQIARDASEYVAGRGPLFDARVADGRIVDGHGDLQADDVFCLDDGPRVLDCLEFSAPLRWGDAIADAAFLAMDLERLGRPDLASRFVDVFRDRTDDDAPPSLLHHHIAYRAHVRCKVACLRAEQGEAAALDAARTYLALAAEHLERGRVHLVLVGGLPGTGKSTLAARLGARPGTVVLRSDVVRKELEGLASDTPVPSALGAGLYATEQTTRTYGALLDAARTHLGLGRSVVLDASWSNADLRARAAALAAETHSELVGLECVCPAAVADARIEHRSAHERDASDATAEIRAAMASTFAPWPDAHRVDTSGTVDLELLPAGVRP